MKQKIQKAQVEEFLRGVHDGIKGISSTLPRGPAYPKGFDVGYAYRWDAIDGGEPLTLGEYIDIALEENGWAVLVPDEG